MAHAHIKDILHLPLLQRLAHKKARKHIVAISVGMGISLFGSYLACNHPEAINVVVWDMMAYSIHGVGLIPIAKHAETIYILFMGE